MFNWSIFHPIDGHKPWDPICRTYYGGWRIHLKYWWKEYFLGYWLDAHILIALCRVGRHAWTDMRIKPKDGDWPRRPNGMPDFEQVPPTVACRRCWKVKDTGGSVKP